MLQPFKEKNIWMLIFWIELLGSSIKSVNIHMYSVNTQQALTPSFEFSISFIKLSTIIRYNIIIVILYLLIAWQSPEIDSKYTIGLFSRRIVQFPQWTDESYSRLPLQYAGWSSKGTEIISIYVSVYVSDFFLNNSREASIPGRLWIMKVNDPTNRGDFSEILCMWVILRMKPKHIIVWKKKKKKNYSLSWARNFPIISLNEALF